MTTAITIRPLSGSTDGRGIKIAASSTPGTTIHTAQASATDCDLQHVWVRNSDTVDRLVTFERGGTTAPDDGFSRTIPAGETIKVLDGLPLRNSLVLKAFGAAANVLVAHGYVERITVA